MKKFYILLCLLCATISLQAQYTTTTTYTPSGTAVQGQLLVSGYDWSPAQIASIESDFAIEHPLATKIGSATRTYNCHAYAWCITEGGSIMWINNYDSYANPNVYRYWTNPGGGYTEVCESLGSKIHYYNGDHSAVKSSISGYYESKWGSGLLVRHDPDDVPSIYNSSYRKYYTYGDTGISGPASVGCVNTSYTVSLPSGWSVAWSVSGSISIAGSSTGSSVNIVSTANGTGVITATFTNSCGTVVVTKNVGSYVTPTFPLYTLDGTCADQTIYITPIPLAGQTITAAYGQISGVKTALNLYTTGTWELPPDVFKVWLDIDYDCGSVTVSKLIPRENCLYRLSAYPNPGDSEMSLELSSESNSTSKNQQSNPLAIPRDVKIFDQRGQVMLSGKMDKIKTNINTSAIPNGNYFLHVANGKDVIKKQIIIKHK